MIYSYYFKDLKAFQLMYLNGIRSLFLPDLEGSVSTFGRKLLTPKYFNSVFRDIQKVAFSFSVNFDTFSCVPVNIALPISLSLSLFLFLSLSFSFPHYTLQDATNTGSTTVCSPYSASHFKAANGANNISRM